MPRPFRLESLPISVRHFFMRSSSFTTMRGALFLLLAASCQAQTLEQKLDRCWRQVPESISPACEVYSLEVEENPVQATTTIFC